MKLVVVGFTVKEPFTVVYDVGETYTYLKNEETGIYYQLKSGVNLEVDESNLIETYPQEDAEMGKEVIEG